MSTRTRLLSELRKNRGSFISGETLSTMLNISRAAVSKHISVLKESGYIIESSPKVGYCLMKTTDLVLPDEIRHGLKTEIIGQGEILHYRVIDSTNNMAKQLAAKGLPSGSLILAEKQSHGRGRKGRSWFSGDGEGICLSLIIRPDIPPHEVSQITLMTAVAIAEVILDITPVDVNIKWPNDLLVNEKKLAGILTEMTMEMDAIDYIVIGLGLNVNTPEDAFSDEIKAIATSLFCETGIRFSRSEIIRAFLARFEHYYMAVLNRGFSSVIKRWKELSDIIGKEVTVDTTGRSISGRVEDIAGDGVLVVRDKSDRIHRILSGDVLI